MFETGAFYHNTVIDTATARKYYEKTLYLYDNFLAAYLGLCQLAIDKNNLHSARINLQKARDINSEEYHVVSTRTEIYKRGGNFNEAEKYLKSVINSFGVNDVRYYKSLASLYQQQDLFEKCDILIANSLERFPSESYFTDLKVSLEERKEWLKIQEKHKESNSFIQWSEDFEDAMKKSVRDKKPVLIEFYSTSEFWSKTLEEKTYPDKGVQAVLKSYIPLKINGELNKELANRYKVNFFSGLVMLNENGEKLGAVRYWLDPPGPPEMIADLNEGLAQYKKYVEGASSEDLQTTEVSNLKDAMILAKSKQIPVMAVFLSRESKWSDKLVKETLYNPFLQIELKNVILVKVDQAVNKSLIKKWEITYFPTIVFTDDKGEILYQVHGYHSPQALADLISDLNSARYHNMKLKNRIRWLYDLEEAKSVAALNKKDILIYGAADWCPFCELAEDRVFSNPIFIETVNERFVPIELKDARDTELLHSFGITAYPTLLILDASLAELARMVGLGNISEVMEALNLDERKPIYSILGPEKYELFYTFESLSDKFHENKLYRSEIHACQKQIQIYPDYWQSYIVIGEAELSLDNPEEAIYYFTKAIDHGAEINVSVADNMLDAYLQVKDLPGFETWLKNTTTEKIEHSTESATLYNLGSEFYEILRDRKSAKRMAEKALKIKPDYADGYLRLGRLNYLEDRLDEAKSLLHKATQLNHHDPRTPFYLGLIAKREGNLKEKERYFELARQKDRTKMGREVGWRTEYEWRSGYFLYPGYLDLIEQGYRDKVELYDDQKVKNELAYFLVTENRNLDEALQLTEQALQQTPDDMSLLDTKAMILYQRGEYQGAHETMLRYEKRITNNDLEQDPIFSLYMGKIKWAVGDSASAISYFRYALKQTESYPRERREQQKLLKFMAEHRL